MSAIGDLEARVRSLEESNEAILGVLNSVVEKVFGSDFVGKIDKLVSYGKEESVVSGG